MNTRGLEGAMRCLLAMIAFAFAAPAVAWNLNAPVSLVRDIYDDHYDLSIVDFDRDGDNDVLALNTAFPSRNPDFGNSVMLYRQLADGSLATPEIVFQPEDPTDLIQGMAVSDFNGDGWTDIALMIRKMEVIILLSNAEGEFTPNRYLRGYYPSGGAGRHLVVYDADADGIRDLVFLDWDGTMAIFFLTPAGTVSHVRDLYGMGHEGYNDVAIGDIDHDGRDDLVVKSGQGSNPIVILGPGEDGLVVRKIYTYAPWPLGGLAIGDYDGDGLQDVAVSLRVNSPAYVDLITFDRSLGIAAFRTLDAYQVPARLVAADLNLDGHQDLLVHYAGWRSIGTYIGQEGGLLPDIRHDANTNDWSTGGGMAVGDVNDDGCPDVVTSEWEALQVHYGNACDIWLPSADLALTGRKVFHQDGVGYIGVSYQILSGNYVRATPEVHIELTSVDHHPVEVARTYTQWGTCAIENTSPSRAKVVCKGTPIDALYEYDGVQEFTLYLEQETIVDVRAWVETDSVVFDTDLSNQQLAFCADFVTPEGTESPHCQPGYVRPVIDVASDVDGDGRSDIFWRRATDGRNVAWSGADHADQLDIARLPPDWTIGGIADFDGDGRDDVLWRHDGGTNLIWSAAQAHVQLPVRDVGDAAWQVVGTGDFDNDGQDDIAWRNGETGVNVIWRSADVRDAQRVRGVGNLDWIVAGVADFDGDQEDDLLWHNPVTGANTIWHSGDARDQDNITDVRNTAWDIAGVGDFDGNGRADILWRHGGNGHNVVWRGGQYGDQFVLTRVADTEWRVAAVGDYDGDGREDLLWRHAVTGRDVIWSAAQATAQRAVRDVTNTEWSIEP